MNVRRTSSNLICSVPVLYFFIKSAHNKKNIQICIWFIILNVLVYYDGWIWVGIYVIFLLCSLKSPRLSDIFRGYELPPGFSAEMESPQQPQPDSPGAGNTEHKVQFLEEELNKMESGEGRKKLSIKEHICTFFSRSDKGILLFCMTIFSISTIYNLIQVFISIFTSWL